MARYDFHCPKCSADTILYSEHQVSLDRVKCETCGYHDPALVQFFESEFAEILVISQQIDDLKLRIEKLEDELDAENDAPIDYN